MLKPPCILDVHIDLQGQKYCSIRPLCHHCEETSALRHVGAAAVSGHMHHMLQPTNMLQSHLTVKRRVSEILCHLPFVQAVTADSSQIQASSVGQPSLLFIRLAVEGELVLIHKAYTNPAGKKIVFTDYIHLGLNHQGDKDIGNTNSSSG